MDRLGETGVAAFAVVNYIILCSLVINCGISDSIQTIVSKNYGAMKAGRIRDILGLSAMAAFVAGLILSVVLILIPGTLTGIFIQSGDQETIALTMSFISKLWPAFLLSGINIVFSSYLTAMNKAFYSTLVSLFRNLFLPFLFILVLLPLIGYEGIFIVLPLSELVTLFIAVYLLNLNSPSKLINKQYLVLARQAV